MNRKDSHRPILCRTVWTQRSAMLFGVGNAGFAEEWGLKLPSCQQSRLTLPPRLTERVAGVGRNLGEQERICRGTALTALPT